MAVTPVTVGLYAEIMQGETPPEERRQLPAVDVTWYDAVEFSNRLSRREGYRPCYRQYFGRWVCNSRADGYRLPTEAEWEYACRAGTTTRYSFGDDPARLERYAWYGKSEGPYEVPGRPQIPGDCMTCTAMSGKVLGLVQALLGEVGEALGQSA